MTPVLCVPPISLIVCMLFIIIGITQIILMAVPWILCIESREPDLIHLFIKKADKLQIFLQNLKQ